MQQQANSAPQTSYLPIINPYSELYKSLNIHLGQVRNKREAQLIATHLGMLYNTLGGVIKDLVFFVGKQYTLEKSDSDSVEDRQTQKQKDQQRDKNCENVDFHQKDDMEKLQNQQENKLMEFQQEQMPQQPNLGSDRGSNYLSKNIVDQFNQYNYVKDTPRNSKVAPQDVKERQGQKQGSNLSLQPEFQFTFRQPFLDNPGNNLQLSAKAGKTNSKTMETRSRNHHHFSNTFRSHCQPHNPELKKLRSTKNSIRYSRDPNFVPPSSENVISLLDEDDNEGHQTQEQRMDVEGSNYENHHCQKRKYQHNYNRQQYGQSYEQAHGSYPKGSLFSQR